MASQVLPCGFLSMAAKTFSSRADVAFGLGFVLGESPFELGRLRRLLHLGKGCQNFLLGEVDVLQRVVKQFIECLGFFLGHGGCLLLLRRERLAGPMFPK